MRALSSAVTLRLLPSHGDTYVQALLAALDADSSDEEDDGPGLTRGENADDEKMVDRGKALSVLMTMLRDKKRTPAASKADGAQLPQPKGA